MNNHIYCIMVDMCTYEYTSMHVSLYVFLKMHTHTHTHTHTQACTGKFHPIKQWFYFDSLESLPEDFHVLPEEIVKPTGSRYDGQTAVFGGDMQKKMERQKYFVVSNVENIHPHTHCHTHTITPSHCHTITHHYLMLELQS